MPKVKFRIERRIKDGTGTVYLAGKTYELSEASAQRWVRRAIGDIVETDDEPGTDDKPVMETMAMGPVEDTALDTKSKRKIRAPIKE